MSQNLRSLEESVVLYETAFNVKLSELKVISNMLANTYDWILDTNEGPKNVPIQTRKDTFNKLNKLKTYKSGTELMHQMKVVPYKFLLNRLSNCTSFKDDKLGATKAIQRALKTLEDTGDIQATKDKFKFQSSALVYAITNIQHFI